MTAIPHLSQPLGGEGVLRVTPGIAPPFRRQNLVVMLPQVQAGLGPRREVVGHGDGAPVGPLVDAVRDVLPEGRGARDGRLVDLLVLPDLVGGAVGLEGAELLALGRALAVGGVLLNIVLDQRVAGPAVDGDEDCARGLGRAAGEGDVSAIPVRMSGKRMGRVGVVFTWLFPSSNPCRPRSRRR